MTPSPSRPRILFVDDEPNVTATLKTLLRRQPWEIVTAHSGAEALAALRSAPFEVVVSDERMPEMSGSELLARVARLHPETIRIILSGQASLEATIRAINEAGIFRFLIKPCEKADLVACIESALEAHARARASAEAAASGAMATAPAQLALLDEAISRLHLVFQPIVDRSRRGIFGYETLMRSAVAAFPHPGAVFDAAEAAGRVLELESAIRERAAAALAELPPPAVLFINLHPQTLADPDFFAEDNPLLRAPDRIVLEVTERASLDGVHDLDERIRYLRERGFRIAIDDLGAGYAGLNSFAKLSPDVVKLDIELIRDVDRSSTKRKVVESMTRLSRELDFLTVAEGIETPGELRAIGESGCQLVQGFLLARPAKGFTLPAWPQERTGDADEDRRTRDPSEGSEL